MTEARWVLDADPEVVWTAEDYCTCIIDHNSCYLRVGFANRANDAAGY